MLPLRLTVLLLAATCFACSGTTPGFPVDDLDFAEVSSTAGWQLRIYGDGSATLRHATLPAHLLHYPAKTFDVRPARRLSKRCGEATTSSVCLKLRYYTAFTDEEVKCSCAPGGWPGEIITRAIASMDLAVEGRESRVSRRMLGRLGR